MTSVKSPHHTNEVKREALSIQQQQQQQQQGDTNLIERANELALDNLNVIYDNDNERFELSLPPLSSNSSNNSGQPADISGSTTAPQSAKKSSFVHGEHGDEAQEQQDKFATCQLESSGGSGSGQVARVKSLAGRLNFWQPIENRGILHMLARLRYELDSKQQQDTTISHDVSTTGRLVKRESFQTPIERLAPTGSNGNNNCSSGNSNNSNQTTSNEEEEERRRRQNVHQIWLLDSCDQQESSNSTQRRLFAELSWPHQGANELLVDIDAELVIGRFNLSEPNSIVGKCLELEAAASLGGERVATCHIVASETLPAAGELEHLASVGVVLPVRQELLTGAKSSVAENRSDHLEGNKSDAALLRA